MEFGLQKSEKVGGSPVIVGNPRKRIEAKAYRARDRMDNGWFRHDTESPINKEGAIMSPVQSVHGHHEQVRIELPQPCANRLCTRNLYKSQEAIIAAGVTSSPRKVAYGSSNVGTSPSKFNPLLPDAGSRLQQQIYPNCSDWYRHEHTILADDTDEEKTEHEPRHSPVPTSWHYEQTGGGQYSPRSRRVCAKAEEYWKRNHDGSAKDWFRHEHTFVEEKENNIVDVDEVDSNTISANEFELRGPQVITDEHLCCICRGKGLSPAKTSNI